MFSLSVKFTLLLTEGRIDTGLTSEETGINPALLMFVKPSFHENDRQNFHVFEPSFTCRSLSEPASYNVPSTERWSVDNRLLTLGWSRNRGQELLGDVAFEQLIPVF